MGLYHETFSCRLGCRFACLSAATVAETLTVQVSGIKDPGEIHIAIYDSAEAFEGDKGEKGGPAEGIVDGVVKRLSPAR